MLIFKDIEEKLISQTSTENFNIMKLMTFTQCPAQQIRQQFEQSLDFEQASGVKMPSFPHILQNQDPVVEMLHSYDSPGSELLLRVEEDGKLKP